MRGIVIPSLYVNQQTSPPSVLHIQPLSASAVIRYLNKEADSLFLCAARSPLSRSSGFGVKWTVSVNGEANPILGFGVIVATIRHIDSLPSLNLEWLPPHRPTVEGEMYSLS